MRILAMLGFNTIHAPYFWLHLRSRSETQKAGKVETNRLPKVHNSLGGQCFHYYIDRKCNVATSMAVDTLQVMQDEEGGEPAPSHPDDFPEVELAGGIQRWDPIRDVVAAETWDLSHKEQAPNK